MVQIDKIYDFLGKEIDEKSEVAYATANTRRYLRRSTIKKIGFYGNNIVVYTDRGDRVRPDELIVIN